MVRYLNDDGKLNHFGSNKVGLRLIYKCRQIITEFRPGRYSRQHFCSTLLSLSKYICTDLLDNFVDR